MHQIWHRVIISWLFRTTIPARLVAAWSNYAGPMGRALPASATRPRQSSSEEIQYLLLLHLVLFHIHGVKKKIKDSIEYRRYSFVFSLSHLLLTPILTADVFSQATNKLLALQKTHRWYFVAYSLLVAGFYWPTKTWCQILCTMRLQCVSKILSPRRMLQKTSLIAKINLWNNSFQNMYDML